MVQGYGDLDNINLIQLPDKSILAACRNHIRGSGDDTYTLYRLQVFISSNNGKDWDFLSNIDTRVPSGVNGRWVSDSSRITSHI